MIKLHEYSAIKTIFDGLSLPKGKSDSSSIILSAEELGPRCLFLAKDSHGSPALLIKHKTTTRNVPSPARMQNLSVQWFKPLQIEEAGKKAKKGVFTLIMCVSDSWEIQEMFLRLVPTIQNSLSGKVDLTTISNLVERLTFLFKSRNLGPSRSLQGLWSELLLIAESSDPVLMAQSWHPVGNTALDFVHGGCSIEVKSTTSGERTHIFKHHQLTTSVPTIVASLLLKQDTNGCSVLQLFSEVQILVASDTMATQNVEGRVAAVIGNSNGHSEDNCYDRGAAVAELDFYPAKRVPQLSQPIPKGVSDVSYTANLDGIKPAQKNELNAQKLWKASRK